MDEGKIIQKLLDHDEQFENIKTGILQLRSELINGQEEMITILKRLDEERIFTAEWIRRVEHEVEALKTTRVKNGLKIA